LIGAFRDCDRPDFSGRVRAELVDPLLLAIKTSQATILSGPEGLGQCATLEAAFRVGVDLQVFWADGCWTSRGYLSGFEEFLSAKLAKAVAYRPDLVVKHEQTLKRIFPALQLAPYVVPRDLTNTADREERTRFYHQEYQNKLLVGLSEFIRDVLECEEGVSVLVIERAERLSPTSQSLIKSIIRLAGSIVKLRFVLLGEVATPFLPDAFVINFAPYPREQFEVTLGIAAISQNVRQTIYELSCGNVRIGQALTQCWQRGVKPSGHLDAIAIVDFYLGTLNLQEREGLAVKYIRNGHHGDLIEERNAEIFKSTAIQVELMRLHLLALESYKLGQGPLILVHALAMVDKFQKLDALVEPFEILMAIGLYDTWFNQFATMFSDPELRSHGSGDEPANGLFINAAFVLYAMGNSCVSAPFLEEFLTCHPSSRYVPTALYAQSMTYGRYQVPVNLELAEKYALRNLSLIHEQFSEHKKYKYILVFAENAYAYIKARQGKFAEALELCERGNREIVATYGEDTYRLHRSILVYNTSQIYEIIGDNIHAEKQLRLAIACDPYYAEYHNDLGNLLSKITGREEEALDAYATAIALSPPYYEANLNRGMLRAQIGDIIGAEMDFRRALDIKPDEWRALRELGTLALCACKYSLSISYYHNAINYESGDSDVHANLGLAYSNTGDRANAIHHYRRALSLNGSHADAHNNIAAELVESKDYTQALYHAELAVKLRSDIEFSNNRDTIAALLTEAPFVVGAASPFN
jgi:Tfp pilus assembly protein PilF